VKYLNERLKWIRAYKKMNQNEFAKSLGIGQSTLAMLEVGKRDITERHIKTVCAIFGIDEHWFRTGDGNPFRQDDQSVIERVAERYNLTEKERNIVADFLELPPKDRAAIIQVVDSLVEKLAPSQNREGAESKRGTATEIAELKRRLDILEEEEIAEAVAPAQAIKSQSLFR